MKCAGGSTCVPHWPTCVNNSREKAHPHRVWALVVPVDCLSRFIRKTGPTRNSRRKAVRKIYVFFGSQQFLDFPKRVIVCRGDYGDYKEKKRYQDASHPPSAFLEMEPRAISFANGVAYIRKLAPCYSISLISLHLLHFTLFKHLPTMRQQV